MSEGKVRFEHLSVDGRKILKMDFTVIEWEVYVVTQLVEVLRYKPEGSGFDSRWCHWIFSLT
jgi:hypothetical protein